MINKRLRKTLAVNLGRVLFQDAEIPSFYLVVSTLGHHRSFILIVDVALCWWRGDTRILMSTCRCGSLFLLLK